MPYAIRYVPPTETGPEISAISLNETMERQARKTWIKKRWDAYEGKYVDLFKGSSDLLVTINPVRYSIVADIYRNLGLNEESTPTSVRFDVVKEGEPSLVNTAPALYTEANVDEDQDYLNRVWDANNKLAFLFDLFLVASITGHAFIKIIPNGVEDFETGNLLPRIVLLNPEFVSVFWSATDVGEVIWYRVRIPDNSNIGGLGAVTRYIVEDHVKQDDGQWGVFIYSDEGGRASLLHSYTSSYPLIVDYQNVRNPFTYYGESDITEGVVGQVETIVFTATNMAKIIQHHAHPKTIAIGIAASQVQSTSVEGLWSVPNEKANIFNLEMQSDLSSSREFLRMLLENVYAEMREVNPTLEGRDLSQVTNFAVRVLYTPSLQKTTAKRFTIAPALRRLNTLLFLHSNKPYVKVEPIFPKPLAEDPAALTSALAMDVQVGGLSKSTYLIQRGYNPDYEKENQKQEQQEALEFAKAQMEIAGPPQPTKGDPVKTDNRAKEDKDANSKRVK